MKISTITIELVPSEGENHEPCTIYRTAEKRWWASEGENPRGFLPSEIRLVHDIQTLIIQKWNSGEKASS